MLLNSIALLLACALLVVLAGRGVLFGARSAERGPDGLTRFLLILFRLTVFIAIAASAALLVDYQNAGDPAFCGVKSGCFAVRVSPYSHIGGVPLPTLGLIAYVALLVGSLLARKPWDYRALAALSGAGGLCALGLIAVQAFAVGAFCAYCLAVDLSAIAAAVVAALIARRVGGAPERDIQGGKGATVAWGAAVLAAIGLPLLWSKYPVVPPPPPDIVALQVPGKITVVGFTDFECPFCRRLYPEMQKLEQQYGDRLRYLRKMMPLSGHPGALPAAKAYVCTPEAKREQAAALLYSAPTEMLTDRGVVELLATLGLPREELSTCLSAPATQAAIAADIAVYDRLQARGLPLTYVGRRVIMGANPARIREALQSESAGAQTSLPLPWLFASLFVVAAGAIALNQRD
jgi:uncharacterized membrane protein/predicted DsbA family dithiol-disulfide isomerase